jgi:hypothetical protein
MNPSDGAALLRRLIVMLSKFSLYLTLRHQARKELPPFAVVKKFIDFPARQLVNA